MGRIFRTKDCSQCGASFREGRRESREAFESRQFCSNRCRSDSQRKLLPPRHCPACGALLVRRARETNYDFRTRKTCGWACAMHSLGRVPHITSRVVDDAVRLEPTAALPEMHFEDDPRARREAGVMLNLLPPPTQTERGAGSLVR